jgi:trans-aconitate 2-methyltransferase
MAWNPNQYLAFAGARMQPAIDLLARIALNAPETVVDLGCGPGNITPLLRQRWRDAAIVGLDNSTSMLERARAANPAENYDNTDIATWNPAQRPAVIYANAALQWLPDHHNLLPRLAGYVAPGGVLAMQIPRNHDAPSHRLVLDVIRDGPWRATLEPVWAGVTSLGPLDYRRLMAPLTRTLDIWETQYLQVLEGDNPVAAYTKGTWLTRFLDPLDEPWRSTFETRYQDIIRAAYPPEPDGKTLFAFRRLFMIATF